MGVINIKDLKADMVLTGDVRDCRGRLLIGKGLNTRNCVKCGVSSRLRSMII